MLFEEKLMIRSSSGLILENSSFIVSLYHREPSRVILSVPHDCLPAEYSPGYFEYRKTGSNLADLNVWILASDMIIHALEQGGHTIDAIRFLLPRAYVDVNRRKFEGKAFADCKLENVYGLYFSRLSRLIDRSVKRFGAENILFLDLHGFSNQPKIAPENGFDLVLGTANRRTIRSGDEVDISLGSFLEQCGYTVFLPREESVVSGESDSFSGGYIIRRIFLDHEVNAIQVEIFSKFRNLKNPEVGRRLALDMANFILSRYAWLFGWICQNIACSFRFLANRIGGSIMANYHAVNGRCAVELSSLQLSISDEEALDILCRLGFSVVSVDMIMLARQCIGVSRYRRGAKFFEAPAIVDCSSFVKWLYGMRGIWLPRRSIQQRDFGWRVDFKDMIAGDLIFVSGRIDHYHDNPADGVGHVGVATDNGTIIHAADSKLNVVEVMPDEFIEKGRFRGVRRYVPNKNSDLVTLEAPPEREVETADDIKWIIRQSLPFSDEA